MNKSPRNLKRIQERHFSAHHMLLRAAERAYEAAEKQKQGRSYDLLAAMTFSALAIEALCNSVGDRMIPDWKDFETSSPNAKLRILTSTLGVEYKQDKAPWNTARELIRFRNQIAHAKPELVVEEDMLTQEEHDQRVFDIPQAKLEKELTLGKAKKAVDAVNMIKSILAKNVPVEKAVGLFTEGWSGTTRLG